MHTEHYVTGAKRIPQSKIKRYWQRIIQQGVLPWTLLIVVVIPHCGNAAQGFATIPDKGGYYFYEKSPVVKSIHPKTVAQKVNVALQSLSGQIQKRNCQNPRQWNATACGFVVPMGQKNWQSRFAFEQQEYKQLLPYSIFSTTESGGGDPQANYQWQRFQNWALDWAMQYSYVWEYARLQHPDVNAVAQAPVSQFGNNLIKNINNANEKAYLNNLAHSAMLVFFTRHGDKGTPQYCPVCQAMAPVVLDLFRTTGIPVYEASLDKKHFAGFNYHLWPETQVPAQILKVAIVPTLFLYLKPNEQGRGAQWIRVSVGGPEAEDTIKRRIVNFVQGFRDAIVSGAKDASKKAQRSPDFRQEYSNWLSTRASATQGSSLSGGAGG